MSNVDTLVELSVQVSVREFFVGDPTVSTGAAGGGGGAIVVWVRAFESPTPPELKASIT
jgi:hypothetical protein